MTTSKGTKQLEQSSNRRLILKAGAAVAAVALTPIGMRIANAQWADGQGPGRGVPQTVQIDKLMESDGLDDFIIGNVDAPVTIVEYASMSCVHCARFHKETLPVLKERYIDTGKARLIFREFPLDLAAAWGSMLARCADDQDRAMELTDALFQQQEEWARGRNEEEVKSGLVEVLEPLNVSRESIDTCVDDKILLHNIAQRAVRAGREFGVTSTPTFFINGLKIEGAVELERFTAVIDPLL
ncbi:MAG: DsbA family protein [Pseudomonadota bacterium]